MLIGSTVHLLILVFFQNTIGVKHPSILHVLDIWTWGWGLELPKNRREYDGISLQILSVMSVALGMFKQIYIHYMY